MISEFFRKAPPGLGPDFQLRNPVPYVALRVDETSLVCRVATRADRRQYRPAWRKFVRDAMEPTGGPRGGRFAVVPRPPRAVWDD